jgi:pimeloyl-ACP methyl ester carboxylesterase
MRSSARFGRLDLVLALVSLALIGWALSNLRASLDGLVVERGSIEETPYTVYRPATGAVGPVIVIAHGFAGSQPLMQAFAVTLARNGYGAITFDFLGHGLNPKPLMGSITEVQGATKALMNETATLVALARRTGDGRVGLLGHSMASDIVVRVAESDPAIAATVAVSMFSPAVTATVPRNLLVIVGDLEGFLKEEALRVVGLAIAPATPEAGRTYGDVATGTARRAVFAPGVEHVGVLFSATSQHEALDWFDQAFAKAPAATPFVEVRGLTVLALLLGLIVAGRPLSRILPVVATPPAGAGLPWRRLWPVLIVPAILTPLILRVLPTDFLPILVGDYLAAHFLAYGLITAAMLLLVSRRDPRGAASVRIGALVIAVVAAMAYATIGIGAAIDHAVTSFVPIPARWPLIGAVFIGTLAYFLATTWATHGEGAGRAAPLVATLLFLCSLVLAVALDFERLFFLAIIVPVIIPFFLVYGLIGHWLYARTGHPMVGAMASASAFALAIGVTFPMLAG